MIVIKINNSYKEIKVLDVSFKDSNHCNFWFDIKFLYIIILLYGKIYWDKISDMMDLHHWIAHWFPPSI